MVRGLNGRLLCLAGAALFALVVALPAAAQSTGIVKGVVKDTSGQPVDGATVKIDMSEGVNRHFETKSNKKGEFVQIGLPPGRYNVTAEKDKMSSPPSMAAVSVGRPADVVVVIGAGGGGPNAKEIAAKNAELKKVFDEGIAASKANDHDGAITAFSKAAEINPNCSDCQYNLAFSYAQKKDYDKAEAAYKKAIELKPEYAEAYNGLATIYNAQRKFDLAAEASKKGMEVGGAGAAGAAGGGNADAMYNQGVILWNAGKIADAKKQFEAAVAANPNHAEAHYQLGMALVNEGNLNGAAEQFDTYLKLSPSGPNAATAKGILSTIKK
ncbi:MAG TPA: tetratricopeptide repeat protein [Vicinamibacterales bacterium]|jgi:tetratricopeptide (TPR) repeat protein